MILYVPSISSIHVLIQLSPLCFATRKPYREGVEEKQNVKAIKITKLKNNKSKWSNRRWKHQILLQEDQEKGTNCLCGEIFQGCCKCRDWIRHVYKNKKREFGATGSLLYLQKYEVEELHSLVFDSERQDSAKTEVYSKFGIVKDLNKKYKFVCY